MSAFIRRLASTLFCKRPSSTEARLLCSEGRILRAREVETKVLNAHFLSRKRGKRLLKSQKLSFLTQTLRIDLADLVVRHRGVRYQAEVVAFDDEDKAEFKVTAYVPLRPREKKSHWKAAKR